MGKFLIKKVPTGFKFDLKDKFGDMVATSEVYTTKAACIKGIQSVITIAPKAPVAADGETVPNPKFEAFQDKRGHFRFRLRSRNGKIIAISEAHMTAYGCDRAIEAVRESIPTATIEEQ